MTDLTTDFADLINRRSAENDSGTPDIVLARFLSDVLAAFGTAVRERDRMTSDAYARGWNDCAATVSTALMAPLPSIAVGISAAEAEASATFDLTIDEVRSLKDDRDGWQTRAENLAHELAEQRVDRVAYMAQLRRLRAWLDELGYDAIAVDARLGHGQDGPAAKPAPCVYFDQPGHTPDQRPDPIGPTRGMDERPMCMQCED